MGGEGGAVFGGLYGLGGVRYPGGTAGVVVLVE